MHAWHTDCAIPGFLSAVHGISCVLLGTAKTAFPDKFVHTDGGSYRGQWKGQKKEGFGVYTYASGAKYEGEWKKNVKEGRGVYTFPKVRLRPNPSLTLTTLVTSHARVQARVCCEVFSRATKCISKMSSTSPCTYSHVHIWMHWSLLQYTLF